MKQSKLPKCQNRADKASCCYDAALLIEPQDLTCHMEVQPGPLPQHRVRIPTAPSTSPPGRPNSTGPEPKHACSRPRSCAAVALPPWLMVTLPFHPHHPFTGSGVKAGSSNLSKGQSNDLTPLHSKPSREFSLH